MAFEFIAKVWEVWQVPKDRKINIDKSIHFLSLHMHTQKMSDYWIKNILEIYKGIIFKKEEKERLLNFIEK